MALPVISAPTAAKKKVLLIDDSEDDGRIIQRYVAPGHLFTHVLDESKIISKIREENPDCIMIDYNLAKLDGMEVLSKLSKINSNKPIAYIFLTGQESLDIAIRAMKNGAHDFLVKSKISQEKIAESIQTSLKKAKFEYKIKYLASHDALTNVWNRKFFEKQLKIQIEKHKDQNTLFAIISVDLDHFKEVNDTYGHGMGDQVLIKTASVLKNNLRKNDIIARLGGDEFIILLKDIGCPQNVETIVNQLRSCFAKPFQLPLSGMKNQSIFIVPSMGTSVFPRDGKTSREIVEKSDLALYRAKKGENNHYLRFDRK